MKTRNKPRFEIEALRDLAGAKVFARGEAYFKGGQVIILSLGRQRVVAQVTGTEDYRTELTGRGEEIGGECSCRAFEDWGFCKHMVAAALRPGGPALRWRWRIAPSIGSERPLEASTIPTATAARCWIGRERSIWRLPA